MLLSYVDATMDHFETPQSTGWENIISTKVALVPAPVAMQPSQYVVHKWSHENYGQVRQVGLQGIYNASEICFRLQWPCEKPVLSVKDNDHFVDAAALLFPLTDNASLFMGAPENPVNIWYWKADPGDCVISNIADGIGTSRIVKSSEVKAQSVFDRGHWIVVFRRALIRERGFGERESISFKQSEVGRLAVAVWAGINSERAGLKAFSPVWVDFSFGAKNREGVGGKR